MNKIKKTIKKNLNKWNRLKGDSKLFSLALLLVFGVVGLNYFGALDIASFNNQVDLSSSGVQVNDGVITLANDYDNGLVGYYPFNSNAYDYSGNNNHGVITGAVSGAGKYGNGYSFDGLNDYILISDSNELDLTTALSLSAWVKFNDTLANQYNNIISKYWSGYELYSRNYGQGVQMLLSGTTGSCSKDTGAGLTDNEWHLVTSTFDGSSGAIYIDGSLYLSCSISGTVDTNTRDVYIGSRETANYWNGSIDDVRIYNRALSSTEVSNLYSNTKSYYTSGSVTLSSFTLTNATQNFNYCLLSGKETKINGQMITYKVNGESRTLNRGFVYGGDNNFNISVSLATNEQTKTPQVEDLEFNCQKSEYLSGTTTTETQKTIFPSTKQSSSSENLDKLSLVVVWIQQQLANLKEVIL